MHIALALGGELTPLGFGAVEPPGPQTHILMDPDRIFLGTARGDQRKAAPPRGIIDQALARLVDRVLPRNKRDVDAPGDPQSLTGGES